MSKEKHGFFGGLIKVLMVIIFFAIGAAILTFGIIGTVKAWYPNYKWISICNIVFGACLLTSPFFMSNKREGVLWIIKVVMAIIFVVIGILFITAGAIVLAKGLYHDSHIAYPICHIVFGALLFTSPYFLKKSI